MNTLEGMKHLIHEQVSINRIIQKGKPFQAIQRTYFATNENVKDSFKHLDFSHINHALSVLSSGDHVFSLIGNGVLNIACFDINTFTEYYALGLRRALILKNNYTDFIIELSKLINSEDFDEVMTILEELLPFMDLKHRHFWKELLNYNYQVQKESDTKLNIIKLITHANTKGIYKSVDYLQNSERYNKLRDNLSKSNIYFKQADITELPSIFEPQFDLIILSNILDYMLDNWGIWWTYEKLQEFERELYKILSPHGTIMLKYIFNFISYTGFSATKIALYSKVKTEDLTNESIIKIPSIMDNVADGLILARKR